MIHRDGSFMILLCTHNIYFDCERTSESLLTLSAPSKIKKMKILHNYARTLGLRGSGIFGDQILFHRNSKFRLVFT